MATQSVATHDGIGHEGVGGHETAQQQRGHLRVAQQLHGHEVGQHKGQQKRQHAKEQHPPSAAPKALHVHLQTSEEHDVEETHETEEAERRVALQHMEAVGADEDACQHQSDDVGNAQPPMIIGAKRMIRSTVRKISGGCDMGRYWVVSSISIP